jgi:Rieske 2Fe-2S family protein
MLSMLHNTQVQLIERVLSSLSGQAPPDGPCSTVPLQNYLDPERLKQEGEILFRSFPLIVAHQSQLALPGSCITHDASGAPILVTRAQDGVLRAFLNICRHRGARLLENSCSGKKALTCRYHAWSYDLRGALLHIPVEEAFAAVDRQALYLTELPVFECGGFVWVYPSTKSERSKDLTPFLQGIHADLEHFGVSRHRVLRSSEGIRATNWKLVIDAFLEGYHAKSLHQASLARFFLDRGVIFDLFGPHVRSIGPRQSIKEVQKHPRESWQIRQVTTPFYFLFPNSILVFHPESVSHIAMFPAGADKSYYRHSFLVETPIEDEEANARHEKTFALIDGVVFQQEDLMIAESIQRGLSVNPGPDFILGTLEYPIKHFHESITRALHGERWGLSST